MWKALQTLALIALTTTTSLAQGFSGGGNPFDGGDDNNDEGGNSGSNNPFSNSNSFFGPYNISRYTKFLTAHAVLATLAFAFFLPLGGILIRLASFKGLWWIHALIQVFAYILYIIAFGIGVWLTTQSPSQVSLISDVHPIIGIILLILLSAQLLLGYIHHVLFVRHGKRTAFSWVHIWLGRIVITLGIINGGLGLRLARRFPLAPPSTGAMVGYGVAAGIMWLAYVVVAAVVGGRRRSSKVAVGKQGKVVDGEREDVTEGNAEGEREMRERYV